MSWPNWIYGHLSIVFQAHFTCVLSRCLKWRISGPFITTINSTNRFLSLVLLKKGRRGLEVMGGKINAWMIGYGMDGCITGRLGGWTQGDGKGWMVGLMDKSRMWDGGKDGRQSILFYFIYKFLSKILLIVVKDCSFISMNHCTSRHTCHNSTQQSHYIIKMFSKLLSRILWFFSCSKSSKNDI